jgi:hypothetical protein
MQEGEINSGMSNQWEVQVGPESNTGDENQQLP